MWETLALALCLAAPASHPCAWAPAAGSQPARPGPALHRPTSSTNVLASLTPCPISTHPPNHCRVIYLEDNDIVHMKGGEYTVFNWSDVDSPSVEVRRTIQTLTMEVGQIMKVRVGWRWGAGGGGGSLQFAAGWCAGLY